MSGKGSKDSRTPDFKARREAYDRIFSKKEKPIYHRPGTRGELVECLRKGIPCEIVSDNVVITEMLINGWINNIPEYTVRESENEYYTILDPIQK